MALLGFEQYYNILKEKYNIFQIPLTSNRTIKKEKYALIFARCFKFHLQLKYYRVQSIDWQTYCDVCVLLARITTRVARIDIFPLIIM